MAERRAKRRRPWAQERTEARFPARRAAEKQAGAAARLERIFYILPRVFQEGGAILSDLAAELDVPKETVAKDLRELIERSYDHLAGLGDDIRITLEGDRVQVFTTGSFRRPVRLSLREAVCLGLGLRLAALSPSLACDERREALRTRLEESLASPSPPGSAPGDLLRRFEAPELEGDPMGAREILLRGATERKVCMLTYLKPGAPEPEERRIRPYTLAHAEGRWYVLAHCEVAGAVRAFRLDRVASVVLQDEAFETPEDFDASMHLGKNRVFHARDVLHARVRYSPVIARWLAERHEGQWDLDGGFLVHHEVADPQWIVRHVLQYAGEAELLEPEELRKQVREAASRIVLSTGA